MTLEAMFLVAMLAVCGLLLILRVADHSRERPANHLLIAAVSMLAAAVTYRFFDTIQHPEMVRTSGIVATTAFAAYLYQERRAWKEAKARHNPPS